jgi:hypothetical protein
VLYCKKISSKNGPDPGSGIRKKSIPDPGGKKALDPGSGPATLGIYKILSKTINEMLKLVTNTIFSRAQKGFTKGRYI